MITLDEKTVIDSLLGKDVTSDVVDKVSARLGMIILPWRKNANSPAEFVRCTGLGREIAKVTAWLGGFGDPHRPRHHGWGYQAQIGSSCDNGIIHVVYSTNMSEKEIKNEEHTAMLLAMDKVDDFLRKEAKRFIILSKESL